MNTAPAAPGHHGAQARGPAEARVRGLQQRQAWLASGWVSHPLPVGLLPLFRGIPSKSSCPLSPGHRGPAHPHSHRGHRAMSSLPGCQLWRLPSASPKQVSLAPRSPAGLMKTAKQNCVGRIVMPRSIWKLFHAFSSFSLPSFLFVFTSCFSYFLHNFLFFFFFTQNNFPHVVCP